MKRVLDLEWDQMTVWQRDVYKIIVDGPRRGVSAPLSVWLHRPEFARHAQALGLYCRYETSLGPRLSELAILIVVRLWCAAPEWHAHAKLALAVGVAPDVVEAIRTQRSPTFIRMDEAALYAFLIDLHTNRDVSQPIYDEAVRELGESGVIDLVGVAGYYTLISMTVGAFRIGVPDGVDEVF